MVNLDSNFNISNEQESRDYPEKRGASKNGPSSSEIPDLFFDEILLSYDLNKNEILLLMYLYRHVYCRPNLYKSYGISPVIRHSDLGKALMIEMDKVYLGVKKLEDLNFIKKVGAGQYFVRKYFTQENDLRYGPQYDE